MTPVPANPLPPVKDINDIDRPHHIVMVAALLAVCLALLCTISLGAQVKAQARPAPTPAWTKGILPISPESYWNAVECGKQGGADPPCVFWDTGVCKNADFALAFYTPYKMVAYEVWRVVSQKQPAPTPNYQEAQRTHITIGVTRVAGSQNALTDLVLKRGGRAIVPLERTLDGGGGRFTFDYPAFAATGDVTISLVGGSKTVTCLIEQPVLTQFR